MHYHPVGTRRENHFGGVARTGISGQRIRRHAQLDPRGSTSQAVGIVEPPDVICDYAQPPPPASLSPTDKLPAPFPFMHRMKVPTLVQSACRPPAILALISTYHPGAPSHTPDSLLSPVS